jgi:hypothetical protein
LQNGELTDKPVQQRQAGGAQHGDGEDDGELRHDVRQAAVFGDLARVPALVNDADHQEEHARRDAVIQLLHHAAGDPVRVHREDSQRAEAQVAHRGVGHQLLPILLHQAHQRAVNDPDDRKHRQNLNDGLVHRGLRQQREREPQEPVSPHLQQHAGQDDGAGGGSLHVRVGQPGVEREHGHLDGEAQEEGPENPLLQAERQVELHQVGNLKRVSAELAEVLEVERQDAQQHQHRTGQRIEEELDGRVQLSRAAPDADDEVHGHQHQFPEDVEQEEIEGNKHPDHARLQQQEHGVVSLDAVLSRVPGGENREEAHQRGEHQQQQADAVDANVVVHAERGNPTGALLELEAGDIRAEARDQRQRNQEPGECRQVGPDPHQALALRRNEEQDRQAGQGRE